MYSPLHPLTPSPLLLYREFFTPIVNGYIWRGGLAILLFGTAWILRHHRKAAEGYGTGLVMLGMLRAEDVPKLRSAHRMGWLLYILSLAASGWFGYYCYDVSTAKPAVENNPLKDIPTAPRNPLSDLGKNPLAPGKPGDAGKPGDSGKPGDAGKSPANANPTQPRTSLPGTQEPAAGGAGSPYAPMPGR